MAQWQSTGGSSQRCPGFNSRRLPAFFTFLYFRLITSKFIYKSKWLLADCSIGMYDLVAQACLKTAYACELVLSSGDHVMSSNYLPTFHVATQGQAICYLSTFYCCCRCANVEMSNLSLMNHSALQNLPPCIHLSLHSYRHEF